MALPTIEELLNEDIFKLLGVEGASEQRKQELLQSMLNTVDARVVNRVASMLSEKDAQAFQHLAESGDAQRLANFLAEKGIDLPKIVSEEATRARVEFVELIRLAQEK